MHAVDLVVFLVDQLGLEHKLLEFLWVDAVIALLDVHGDEVQLLLAARFPLIYECFISLHNVIVVKDRVAKPFSVHPRFHSFEDLMGNK